MATKVIELPPDKPRVKCSRCGAELRWAEGLPIRWVCPAGHE